jgi:DMSO/TMAO reductase YedYZ molybdopterin-dependent catalytic subunit
VDSLITAVASPELGFPAWLRITHFINFVFVGVLIRSGVEILSSHPRLYWRTDCGPGTEWLRLTKSIVPAEEGQYMARDDELVLPKWFSLPGGKKIGIGRRWHGLTNFAWMITGIIYVGLLFGTGEWRRLLPTSWDIFPRALDSLRTYLTFNLPPVAAFHPYDALQQLMYAFIVFVVAPMMILTGIAMSPSVIGRFPWYAKLFGNRQGARSLHFIGMVIYLGFALFHVTLVFVVYPAHNVTHMVFGEYRPKQFGAALAIMLTMIAAVVAFWLWQSWWSHQNLRRTQVILNDLEEPIRKLFLGRLKSRQRGYYKESDISPYHWSNGRPPTPEESPEWEALRKDDWRGYQLEIGGLTNKTVSLCMDDLRDMPRQEQITMHTCMQGWTGIAKWGGVRLSDVIGLVEPDEKAKYLMLTSFGTAQHMYDGRPVEPYYTCLPKELVYEDETILAFDMNGQPLPMTFGAPLRLRVESIHGYKMVKYLHKIEWIEDYHTVGDGMGGTREDSSLQSINARI